MPSGWGGVCLLACSLDAAARAAHSAARNSIDWCLRGRGEKAVGADQNEWEALGLAGRAREGGGV
eukprot:1465645-Pleurochrysis_carterae.AAC.1